MKMPEGKYVLVKDPNKSVIRLYDVPIGTFEDDDDATMAATSKDGDKEKDDEEVEEE
jgi:translation initiation factor 3 subunit D